MYLRAFGDSRGDRTGARVPRPRGARAALMSEAAPGVALSELAIGQGGKIVALDTQSADFELDTDLLTAGDRLRARHPEAAIWFTRVGYKTAFAVGGALTRG